MATPTVQRNTYMPFVQYEFNTVDFQSGAFRAKDSDFKIRWDADDDVPAEIRQMLNGPVRAVVTNGNGACAIHSVFGRPSARKELFLSEARDLAVRFLTALPAAAAGEPVAARALEAIHTSLWDEFSVPFLRKFFCGIETLLAIAE